VTHSSSRSKNIEKAEVVAGIFAADNHDAATKKAQKQILDLGQMDKIPPIYGIENFKAYKSEYR
jgi:hypothetical protein